MFGFANRRAGRDNHRLDGAATGPVRPVLAVRRSCKADLVLPRLRVTGKKALLEELSQIAAPIAQMDHRILLTALQDRERIGCTGIGQGVALPHARFAAISRPVSAFARLASPIEYEAVDGRRVDLIYLLMSPETASDKHLTILARAARVLRDQAARLELRLAEDESAIRNIFAR